MKYQNANYQADAEFTVKVAKSLLSPVGLWPLHGNKNAFDRYFTVVKNSALFGLMCFLLLPHVYYTFFDAEDKLMMMKVIAAQVFSSLAVIKYWTMVLNKQQIREILEDLEGHWRDIERVEDRDVMLASAKIGRIFTVAYLGLSYGGALPYHIILPLMSERDVLPDNSTRIPLPYLTDYVFFDIPNSPYYECLYITQLLISSIILTTNTGVYSLIASCVQHSCCLFQVVRRQIDNITKESKNTGIRARLSFIIDNHVKAIQYAEKIEKALSIVFLAEMLGCTLIICFLEYGVLMEWEYGDKLSTGTYFMLMSSIFVNVYIFSYTGDQMKQESILIGESVYSIIWYDLPVDVINDLSLIITRTMRPSKMTAGNMSDLSLQGFMDVIRTSAAYLNFIRTMTAKSSETN